MKKTLTILSLALSTCMLNAQTVADFETFSLSANSAYSPTTSTPFQTSNAVFEYDWNSSFSFWSGGFSYTNKYDSVTAGFSNLYGVRALKGVNNSATYVVAQDGATIKLSAPHNTVTGFYVTNTTYAYKAMAKGDAFSRKFGDTTGTGSGTTIPQGSYPDFFKIIVKGYHNGVLKNDSVEVFLANFTFTNNAQDFILDSWSFVNTSILGTVDSIQFHMLSSDTGAFGINTPLFFALDNFGTSAPNPVGLTENNQEQEVIVSPNPCTSFLSIRNSTQEETLEIVLRDLSGKVIRQEKLNQNPLLVDVSDLQHGVYFLETSSATQKSMKKIIKN